MILIIDKNFNPFHQFVYDSYIASIKCSHSAFFDAVFGPGSDAIFHGTYTRTVVSDSGNSRTRIRLQRILDKNTGLTHTLIPSQIVPYSAVPLQSQLMIISAAEKDLPSLSVLFNLDPGSLLHIRSIFHAFWQSLLDWLSIPVSSVTATAFRLTGRQFMQMRGHIRLYPPT